MPTRPVLRRARAAARPRPIRRPWRARVRGIHARLRARAGRWQLAYLAVLALLARWTAFDRELYGVALVAWVIAGAHAWVVATWLGLDLRRRRLLHDQSGLPTLRGWRLIAPIAELDADLLLSSDILLFLFDHVRLVAVPIRGRRRFRTTYDVSLRDLARQWARARGLSGRRGDRILAERLCTQYGLVRRVPIGNASAFRLVDESAESALARLEAVTGQYLVAWKLGRDPAWDVVPGRSELNEHPSEPARA